MSRIDILENSLKKKKDGLDNKFNSYFSDVAQANGQPMNDKKGGHKVLDRWERKSQSIHNQKEEIKKTEMAIEKEKEKIIGTESVYLKMPNYLKDLIDKGILIQWRKHPRMMFVKDVDNARIIFDEDTKICSHKYVSKIKTKDEYIIFRDIYNNINKLQKD